MRIDRRIFSPAVEASDLRLSLVFGGGGFLLNMMELNLGWGLHFMFGNALVFGLARVLRPQWLVLAASISSLRSVFLWNHPWAWIIWTLEAAFVSRFARRMASPVRASVLYWLLVGTPLLIISYGVLMDMDRLSLWLVIVKQAVNGVLNVVIGEIIYLVILNLKIPGEKRDWPKMPIESFLTTLLLAIILIPSTVYLYIDAPAREQAAKARVADRVENRLEIIASRLSMWAEARATLLSMFADKQRAVGNAATGDLPESLRSEFTTVGVLGDGGRMLWPPGASCDFSGSMPAPSSYRGKEPRIQLVAIAPVPSMVTQGASQRRQLVLVVPSSHNKKDAAIFACIRDGALQKVLSGAEEAPLEQTFLINSEAGIMPLSQSNPVILQLIHHLPESVRSAASSATVLISSTAYGTSLMSDLRDGRMIRASVIPGVTDWKVLSIAGLSPEVLKAREAQLQVFTALSLFVLLVTALAAALSKRTGDSLRRLAQSAADLAMLGTERDKIDSLIISELNDISGKIASARSMVSQERGALARYQRRLNSIARHAPIVVYALDVRDNQKGELVYISEALETILGYTRAEVASPGWWSHAIHPEDYGRCSTLFGYLQPGKVVTVEYRLRHKLGHYVWVDDTLSVEASATSNRLEAVGVLIDISDRKAAAQQLIQADKMASLGRMISGTAHELNQPLNFIKMAASNLREHIRRGQLDTDRFETKLESILSHVSRASAIILQMRVFGRMPKETPFPIDVKTAIDAVLKMAMPQLELDGTRVDTSECASGVKVRALPVLLEQVLLNLVLNANDAIRVRHNAGDPSEGWLKVSIVVRNWLVEIILEDNGTGLSPEVLPVVFEPFFTTKPPKEGTGLGLSISYGIIRDLGGTIRAENAREGARFIIELPLAI